jgi:hypothetical protein
MKEKLNNLAEEPKMLKPLFERRKMNLYSSSKKRSDEYDTKS